MALTDLIKVQKVYTNEVGEETVTNIGFEERTPVSEILADAPATATTAGTVMQAAFIAQVAVPFADLTAAANAHNALLTALKDAGIMEPTA